MNKAGSAFAVNRIAAALDSGIFWFMTNTNSAQMILGGGGSKPGGGGGKPGRQGLNPLFVLIAPH